MALGFVIFLVICGGVYLHFHHAAPPLGTAYAGERGLTLYNSSAQVHESIGTVDYGEPLLIEQQFGDQVEVRTSKGLVGWTTADDVIPSQIWQEEKELNDKTAQETPESEGHTAVISNLHLDPGREAPRVRQLRKDVPLELFSREPETIPQTAVPGEEPVSDTDSADSGDQPKKEDWWLVRARVGDDSYVSGWMLGRFIDLDVPEPLPDYASTANMRIVAWFPLNPAMDTGGHEVPQYLLVGTTGPEGGACDFTMMRVFTWSKKKAQYETAFVNGDVCGKLPIDIVRLPVAQVVTMTFKDPSDDSQQVYRMQQTIVRHISGEDAEKKEALERKEERR